MKAKTFKALLTSIILLCSITSMYAQEGPLNLYWRAGATSSNFNNSSNWTEDPDDPAEPFARRYPTPVDNVFFTTPGATHKSITVSDGGNASMASLTVTESGFSFVTNTDYYITGNIDVHDSFTITGKVVYLDYNAAYPNVTINIGDSEKRLGEEFRIRKPGHKVTLQSAINTPNTRIYIMDGSFDSNGKDIYATELRESTSHSSPVERKYSGSRMEFRDIFYIERNRTEYKFDNSNILTRTLEINQYIGTLNGAADLELNDVTITGNGLQVHETSGLYVNGHNYKVKFNNLKINTPRCRMNGDGSFDVNIGAFTIMQQTTLRFTRGMEGNPLQLSINSLSEPYADAAICGDNSVFEGNGGLVHLKANVSKITTRNITYKNIHFSDDGEMWEAPDNCNGGLNTGVKIDWTYSPAGREFRWSGNTGDWHDLSNWQIDGNAADCLPSIKDDVYIDDSSFDADGQTIILSRPGFCNNIYWENNNSNKKGRLIHRESLGGDQHSVINRNDISLTISGNVDFSGVKEFGILPDLYFVGAGTIKSAQGGTYRSRNIFFNSTGNYSLVNDFISSHAAGNSVGSAMYHYSGGLISNGKTIEISEIRSIPNRLYSARTLNLENSEIIIRGHEWGLIRFDRNGENTSENLTYNFNGSHFNIKYRGSFVFEAADSKGSAHPWRFNKITYEISNLGAEALLSFSGGNLSKINELTAISNLRANNGFIAGTLNLYTNKTYKFAYNGETHIENEVNVIGGDCEMLTLICSEDHGSNVSLLRAGFSPFEIGNANISRIHVVGDEPLIVKGGIDRGNNNDKVHITPRESRTFYWVGGTGDWNDVSHWSIEVSGGDPQLTNPSNCIPSVEDIVYFDGNSFDGQGQIVYANQAIAVKSMIWTEGVNNYRPFFRRKEGFSVADMIIYGSLEFAENMVLAGDGEWDWGSMSPFSEVLFRGDDEAINSQYLNTHGVHKFEIRLQGKGRYELRGDMRGSVRINNTDCSFITNSFNISDCYHFDGNSKILDFGESIITAEHVNIRSSVESAITSNSSFVADNMHIDLDGLHFRTISYRNELNGGNNGANRVYADSIIAIAAGGQCRLNATVETNVFDLRQNGFFNIVQGLTVTVNDTIIAFGSRCNYSVLQTVTPAGGTNVTGSATIKSSKESLLLGTYFTVSKIIGDISDGTDYYVLGNSNDNINIVSYNPEDFLTEGNLPKIIRTCNDTYMFADVRGYPVYCRWYKNNVLIEGFTDNAYPVTLPGVYTVEAHYSADGSCGISYTREVEFNPAPDLEILASSNITKSGDNRTVNIHFENIGEIPTGSQVYITLYVDTISPESILESGSIAGPITVGGPGSRGHYTFTFVHSDTITNVIARVNDRGGNFPYEPECLYDNNTITLANEASDARGYYVTVSGDGDKSGYDWENAMSNEQFHARLFRSVSSDVYHVAEGIYYPESNTGPGGEFPSSGGGGGLWEEEELIDPDNKPMSRRAFILKEGVSIIGSYKPGLTGTDNDLVYDRNHIITATGELVPTTIFSGDLNKNGVLDDKDATVLMVASNLNAGDTVFLNGIEMTNAYRGGIYSVNTNIDMEYCKVTNIRFEGPGTGTEETVGVLAFNGGNLNIRKSAITHNNGVRSGYISLNTGNGWGTIRMEKADLSIYNSVISNNSVGVHTASAIYIKNDKFLKIYNSTISDNTTLCEKSGAVYIAQDVTTADIINSTIAGNKSTHASPLGAGIVLESRGHTGGHRGPEPFYLDNTIVSGNDVHNITLLSTEQGGGGGGGLWDEEQLIDPDNKPINYKDGYLFDQNVFLQGQNSHYQHFIAKYSIIDKYFVNGSVSATDVNFSAGTHLGSLAHNGGATKTRALLETSTPLNYAINGGNPDYVGTGTALDGLNMDQREELRSSMPSIGAYEFKAAPLQVEKKAELLGVKSKGTYANPVSVLGNEKIKYTITAVNLTPMNDNLTIIDTLPAYMTFVDDGTAIPAPATSETSAPHGNPKREVLRWSFPIAAMGSDSVSFYAQPKPGEIGRAHV